MRSIDLEGVREAPDFPTPFSSILSRGEIVRLQKNEMLRLCGGVYWIKNGDVFLEKNGSQILKVCSFF